MEIKISFFAKFFTPLKNFLLHYRILILGLLVLIPLAYLALIFFSYAWQMASPEELPDKKILIDSKLYEKVMANLKERDKNFSEEETRTYADPFK